MVISLTYRGETRTFDIADLYMSEEELLEKYTGWLQDEWKTAWSKGHPTAWRFGWWLAGRRSGLTEKFGEVDLNWRELEADVLGLGDTDEPAPADEDGRLLPTGPSADPAGGTDEPKSELTSL